MFEIKIPDIKKILEPRWAHKVGWGVDSSGWHKRKSLTQATIPKEQKILQKLGIKKGEKVLAIAGFYADWASKLAKSGAKLDYSDISHSMVNYVKKKRLNIFGKYICSNYELIPKKPKEYDWTFTFEACGARQGLPIAYLRSLLNNKGGILVLYFKLGKHMGGKARNYPKIVKNLSGIYKTQYNIKNIKFNCKKEGCYSGLLPHRVYILKTNNPAREKAEIDIKILDYLKNKKSISLEKDSTKLKLTKEELTDSIKRLNKITKILGHKFVKNIKINSDRS